MGQEMSTQQRDQVTDCITVLLQSYNSGISQEQFYAANILDVTDVAESDLVSANREVLSFCAKNGVLAALPLFETGSYIDAEQGRYISWRVLEIGDDYFRLCLDHYPIVAVDSLSHWKADWHVDHSFLSHRCWYRGGHIVVRVKSLTASEHRDMISHHPDYVLHADRLCGGDPAKKSKLLSELSERLMADDYIGGVLEECEFYFPQDLKKICKKGKYYTTSGELVNGKWVRDLLEPSKPDVQSQLEFALHSMQFESMGPVIEMFVYVNYLLSQKSTTSSTLRHITSLYSPVQRTEELRKERHFGKLRVVSEKKPIAVTSENIQRVYTAVAWQRRGHLRHYKSGKVVPIKSVTCRRHGVEDATASQVVYKV